jgi:hypothetical protein
VEKGTLVGKVGGVFVTFGGKYGEGRAVGGGDFLPGTGVGLPGVGGGGGIYVEGRSGLGDRSLKSGFSVE